MELKRNPTLADIQSYVAEKIEERGFADETTHDKFILLVEEVGELAKALRPLHGVKTATDSAMNDAADELTDIFWLVLCLCNKLDIDLETALRAKEAKNLHRTWV